MNWLKEQLRTYQIELYYVVKGTGIHYQKLKNILDDEMQLEQLSSYQAIALLEFFEKQSYSSLNDA